MESARKQDYDAVLRGTSHENSVDVYSINSIREVLHALESNAHPARPGSLPAQVRTVAEALMHVARDLRNNYINTP